MVISNQDTFSIDAILSAASNQPRQTKVIEMDLRLEHFAPEPKEEEQLNQMEVMPRAESLRSLDECSSTHEFDTPSGTSTPFSEFTNTNSSNDDDNENSDVEVTDDSSEEVNVDETSDERKIEENKNKNVGDGKPQPSYNRLIMNAILKSPYGRLTLSEIYQSLMDDYPYFRKNKRGWQNSIRHNLSLSKYFTKIRRSSCEPGKGHYWTLHSSAHELDFDRTSFKLRRKNPVANRSRVARQTIYPPAMMPYVPATQMPAYYPHPINYAQLEALHNHQIAVAYYQAQMITAAAAAAAPRSQPSPIAVNAAARAPYPMVNYGYNATAAAPPALAPPAHHPVASMGYNAPPLAPVSAPVYNPAMAAAAAAHSFMPMRTTQFTRAQMINDSFHPQQVFGKYASS